MPRAVLCPQRGCAGLWQSSGLLVDFTLWVCFPLCAGGWCGLCNACYHSSVCCWPHGAMLHLLCAGPPAAASGYLTALTVLLLGCVLGECPAQHTLLVVWAAARCLHALISQPDTPVLGAKLGAQGTQAWVFWGVKLLLPEQAGCGRKTCASGG